MRNLKGLITSGYLVEADEDRDAGWDVFNVGTSQDPLYALQRVDEDRVFCSDLEAIGYVLERAASGDAEARTAMETVYGITFPELEHV